MVATTNGASGALNSARAVVNQVGQFLGTHGARRTQAQAEQNGVNNITFTRAVGPGYGCKPFFERDDRFAGEGFKVVNFNLKDVHR